MNDVYTQYAFIKDFQISSGASILARATKAHVYTRRAAAAGMNRFIPVERQYPVPPRSA